MSSVFEHLDEAVERLGRLRDALLADEFAVDRAARLSMVFASEALAWSQVFELSDVRLVWRAALAAEAGARANAALWAARATAEGAGGKRAPATRAGGAPVQSWAAGRVEPPRPVALTSGGLVDVVGGR